MGGMKGEEGEGMGGMKEEEEEGENERKREEEKRGATGAGRREEREGLCFHAFRKSSAAVCNE